MTLSHDLEEYGVQNSRFILGHHTENCLEEFSKTTKPQT